MNLQQLAMGYKAFLRLGCTGMRAFVMRETTLLRGNMICRAVNMSSTDSDPVSLASEGMKPDPRANRREALWLYRDILRTARQFTWTDKDGKNWRDKLVASAKNEFVIARDEKDPAIIGQLLVGGRQALMEVSDRMLNKARKLVEEERAALNAQSGNRAGSSGTPQMNFAKQDSDSWKQSWTRRHEEWDRKK
jgi:hypothetical protein